MKLRWQLVYEAPLAIAFVALVVLDEWWSHLRGYKGGRYWF